MPIEPIDQRPFCQLLHAMLRHDGTEVERERANLVMQWMSRTSSTIDCVLKKEEMRLLGEVWKIWDSSSSSSAPTRVSLGLVIPKLSQHGDLLALLAAYDAHEPNLTLLTHMDMEVVLQSRTEDAERYRFSAVLENARLIADGRIENKNKHTREAKPFLEGTRDALGYVMERIAQGILINDERSEGGKLSEKLHLVEPLYSQNKADLDEGRLYIPTGIKLIDQHLGGLRRKDFNAVLGYVGQRKSAVIRTMGYHAASSGFRVLHIPLESDFNEEMIAYLVIHAHINAHLWPRTKAWDISRRDFDAANLTEEQRKFLLEVVSPHFAQGVGCNLTVYEPRGTRSWADVKAYIDRESLIEPVHLVVIDYLTLLSPDPNNRDKDAAMMDMIREAKQVAMNSNRGAGLCFVTPVQGSRKGLEAAVTNEGAWEISGISRYSEMDKSLDNCFYVFTTPDLSRANELKMGSCKMRRALDIPPSFVSVNPKAGLIVPHQVLSSRPSSEVELLQDLFE